jgi:hypothetical protein
MSWWDVIFRWDEDDDIHCAFHNHTQLEYFKFLSKYYKQSMLFVGNLQIINVFETSSHCFLIKNKDNDMTGIVQLKVKSLKAQGHIIY